MTSETGLRRDLTAVLNRHSAENGSDTPDYILAQFLHGCLAAFDEAVLARQAHGGERARRRAARRVEADMP